MKRILFVDDDPNLVGGLRNLLRRYRRQWDMVFAVGGQAALDQLKAQPFDVLVTDMRMPGIDGADLLQYVQQEHPRTVRIVLSGYMEVEAALKAVPVAHQFLSKPCTEHELENVIERACNLQALIDDENLRQTIGKIDKLPSLPRVYAAVMRELADEKAGAKNIAEILKQDVAICAKLLQVVNSSFFRLAKRIANVEQAVHYLGFNMVKNLVLTVEVFEDIQGQHFFSSEMLQQHSLRTATIAKQLVADKSQAEDAFMAGMLHDIGKLIMTVKLPDHLAQAQALADREHWPIYRAEQQILGVTHAEIGAYLLGLWGLPYPIIEAVANHHCPTRVVQPTFGVLAAVYAADLLAHETTEPPRKQTGPVYAAMDTVYLAQLGVTDHQIESWRAKFKEQPQ